LGKVFIFVLPLIVQVVEMEEVIEEIKGLFSSKGVEPIVSEPEKTEDGKLLVVINFEVPFKLSDEERDEMHEILRNMGFHLTNGYLNQVNDFTSYKEWFGEDEYTDDNGNEVRVEYTKVKANGETSFYIHKIVAVF